MVLILILIGVILVIVNGIALKKEKKSFENVFHDKENNIQDFQVEIGKIRKDMAENVMEIQSEIELLKKQVENFNKIHNENEKTNEDIISEKNKVSHKSVVNKIEDNNYIKVGQVQKMMNSGMSVEDISNKLDIGKGEVLLIKELYLK